VGIQPARQPASRGDHGAPQNRDELTDDSLVKGGVVVKLPAIALSIKPGGSARKMAAAGGPITHCAGISPLELHSKIDSLEITDGVTATGGRLRETLNEMVRENPNFLLDTYWTLVLGKSLSF